ncbi:up-regulator of cell proliferation-like isoform X1 [Colossoma macropomum]|uniref:up-regulator of cell proliferation-like isoform X1 n=1 Tax=Colossoma macropomum TaxID=42526 RepID=UPI0018643F62|nr:up-regulator of cell proliferation-like isoform X1 [Colossoma macropomum]XP_036453493.1 up-regulator of cell proliferation-like isoform X1 [Colossoma macropomum]
MDSSSDPDEFEDATDDFIQDEVQKGSSRTCFVQSGNEEDTVTSKEIRLYSFLQDLGLEHHYQNKLSLSTALQIDKRTVRDDPGQSLSALPWCFLKKLMMVNVTARNISSLSDKVAADSSDWEDDQENDKDEQNLLVNPSDIVNALFLCADNFLQQEMVSKMSVCQFSVPLLLPNCATNEVIFMLWAMRDIVKKYKPHSLEDPNGFVEDRIVLSDIPLVSFVRLDDCSTSKSQILNKLLSNPQQYHDIFVHKDMECGDVPRKISNGLVEISWYLPCGNKNIDIFPEPVAVANLRGDISMFETQYSFLCQTSNAVFVFFDKLDKHEFVTNQPIRGQLFLIGNSETSDLKTKARQLNLKRNNVIFRAKQNEDSFVKTMRAKMNTVIKNSQNNKSLEKGTEVAHELGILVDEDITECKNAKVLADKITSEIRAIPQFKETQLPLQGEIWKELSKLEKEESRLQKAGDQSIEMYKSDLSAKKKELRKQQCSFKTSETMAQFMEALSRPRLERAYFFKWMRMNLDNLTTKNVSALKEQYQKCQESSRNKEEISKLDKEISCCSLGIEHFLRELGQVYESVVSLSEKESEKQISDLPKLCAELLLEGFPLELLDGEASNIPMRWISDVLKELNDLLQPNNKIMAVTVLGVQSTGKSTLLNTMFGVQFAVSSGRCTRGAFVLLLKVTEEFRKVLNCDYLVIIDTEGLKSPELAQLDNSHEHDNELATLVVGLSDVAIINIAMENSTDMKDILQIVVHAFLRMKQVGKKPKCLFVHQNVGDVSAHNKNIRDRTLLLDQLNEMTELAAKMENNDQITRFTDVMEYDAHTSNWYIPGLWHGNPPMASVSAGYSETIAEFKKRMIDDLGKCKTSRNNMMEFLEWTKSLWSSVKFENFIFSFRNSIVADAYRKICVEFNKWAWSFRKNMHTWTLTAETNISNFGKFSEITTAHNLNELVSNLKSDALSELSKEESTILNNIASYYEQTEGHVELVERYKEDFMNSGKSLRRELENTVNNKLDAAATVRKAVTKLEYIRKTQRETMEQRVLALLEEYRKSKFHKTDQDLEQDFEKMWNETIEKLSFQPLPKRSIMDCVFKQLRINLQHKGSSVTEELDKTNLMDCGTGSFNVTVGNKLQKLLHRHTVLELQMLSERIVAKSEQFIAEKVATKTDYDDTYVREVLQIVDEGLISYKTPKHCEKIEVPLKKHICGIAGKKFQTMHDSFIQENDPCRCLEQSRDMYCSDFKDLFHERDQCQKKAKDFADCCLMPAVEAYLFSALGIEIVDEMTKGKIHFSTRTFFQEFILKELLDESNYLNYLKYIITNESFIKSKILIEIVKCFIIEDKLAELEEQLLTKIAKDITKSISKAQVDKQKSSSIKDFIFTICKDLEETLVIPVDSVEELVSLNNAKVEQFAEWLTKSVEEMKMLLQQKCEKQSLEEKIENLQFKPVEELIQQLVGCGEQCPFCGVPCEATGTGHTEHFATIHRPQGLISYHSHLTTKLVTDICTSSVFSEKLFICEKTGNKPHPYKRYSEIYPNWRIPPDTTEASNYWKYVMAKFSEEFASYYKTQPADIPPAWKHITKEQAENSLKKSFGGT